MEGETLNTATREREKEGESVRNSGNPASQVDDLEEKVVICFPFIFCLVAILSQFLKIPRNAYNEKVYIRKDLST